MLSLVLPPVSTWSVLTDIIISMEETVPGSWFGSQTVQSNPGLGFKSRLFLIVTWSIYLILFAQL